LKNVKLDALIKATYIYIWLYWISRSVHWFRTVYIAKQNFQRCVGRINI